MSAVNEFDPACDAFALCQIAQPAAAQALTEAIPAALEQLRASFLGAEHSYDAPQWCERFAASPPADLLAGIASVAAAMDYYRARRYTPARARGSVLAYLATRTAGILRARAADLLTHLAVLSQIPSDWMPVRPLEQRLSRSMRAAGALTATASITLSLPCPGGAEWVRQTLQPEAARIRDLLARGAMSPLVLFTGTGDRARAIPALAYSAAADKITVYLPDAGRGENLVLKGAPGAIGVLGNVPCAGLLALDPTPVPPPIDWYGRAIRRLGLSDRVWRFVRARRRRRSGDV